MFNYKASLIVIAGVLVESGFLQRDALKQLVDEDAAGQQDRSKHLWHILTLEYWYRSANQGAA